jgi:septal ring factor EnvC (AmiA/AmiB activator)
MKEVNENKRVIIQDDGQVVIYNDNARIDALGITSPFEGDYLIGAESVMKLCAMRNDASYLLVHDFWVDRSNFFSITKHDDFDAKIKEINEYIDRNLKSHKDYKEQIEKLKYRVFTLEHQIEQFNATRHWWERKLKIKE